VHNEGRKLGNYISIFLHCDNTYDRKELLKKLQSGKYFSNGGHDEDQKLIEVTDAFDVRWVLGV
jgi:hypothetical protein